MADIVIQLVLKLCSIVQLSNKHLKLLLNLFLGLAVEISTMAVVGDNDSVPTVLRIPFFEKAFAIIYNGKEKHHGEYAETLKATIEERLEALGVDKPQIRIEDENDLDASVRTLEESRHLIFVGEPKLAKDLMSAMKGKWDFEKYGIRFGTFGEKSIITVSALKKKQYKDFFSYAQEQQLRQKSEIEKSLKNQEDTILKTMFDKDEPLAVNIMAGILGSWLILPSALLDLSTISDEKEKLIGLQYSIAIDQFIASKIKASV